MTFNPFSALTSKIFGGALVVALAVCALLYATSRHYQSLAEQRRVTIEQIKVASAAADAAARKAIADTEARYKEQANEADADHAAAVADASTDADRYIAANRVPACPGRAPSGTPAPASGGSAGVLVSVPSGSIVSDADLHACAGAAAYAIAAHEFAVGLDTSAVGVGSDVK